MYILSGATGRKQKVEKFGGEGRGEVAWLYLENTMGENTRKQEEESKSALRSTNKETKVEKKN